MKSMTMKNASAKLFAAILFFTIAIASLQAQTNAVDDRGAVAPVVAGTNVQAANVVAAITETDHPKRSKDKNQHADVSAARYMWNQVANNCVPLAWVFASFAIPVTIVIICAYTRHRRHKMANETLRGMIDKGLPITPELVNSLKSKHSSTEAGGAGNQSNKDLRSGLILTGIGIGVVMLCGKPGWIILFIGVAFLLIGFLKLGKGGDC
ncbi:MAG: hypothetical protein RL616_2614 [Verrucomicrobiota bacterium]